MSAIFALKFRHDGIRRIPTEKEHRQSLLLPCDYARVRASATGAYVDACWVAAVRAGFGAGRDDAATNGAGSCGWFRFLVHHTLIWEVF